MAKKSKLDMILEKMEEGFREIRAEIALIKQCPAKRIKILIETCFNTCQNHKINLLL